MIRRLFEKLKLIKPRQPHLHKANVSGSLSDTDFVCGKCKAWGCNTLMGLFEHREQCVGGNDR